MTASDAIFLRLKEKNAACRHIFLARKQHMTASHSYCLIASRTRQACRHLLLAVKQQGGRSAAYFLAVKQQGGRSAVRAVSGARPCARVVSRTRRRYVARTLRIAIFVDLRLGLPAMLPIRTGVDHAAPQLRFAARRPRRFYARPGQPRYRLWSRKHRRIIVPPSHAQQCVLAT